MSSYRDDRAALRQQIDDLEGELAHARNQGKREQIEHELAALAEQLEQAREKVEGDRAALDEIGVALTRLRKAAGVAQAPASPTPVKHGPTLLIIAGVAGIVGLAVIGVLSRSGSNRDAAPAWAGIPGAPHAVDPIALLDGAARVAGKHDHLVSIEADYVRADGTVDLAAETYRGQIKYTFGTDPPEPDPDPSRPIGAPQPSRDMPVQRSVVVSAAGMEPLPAFIGFGSTPVRRPRCTVAQVWQAAIAGGAPEAAVAKLRYSAPPIIRLTAMPPALWKFTIAGTRVDLEIDDDTCRVRGAASR